MKRIFCAVGLVAFCVVGLSAGPQHEAGLTPQNGPAKTAANPKLQEFKHEVVADIDSRAVFIQQMIDQVFSFGELGFQEFETSKYLTGILEKNGFAIQRDHRACRRHGWPAGAAASR